MTKPDPTLDATAETLRSLPLSTAARSDGLERIVAARSRGERRPLPPQGPAEPHHSRLFVVGLAAAALLAVTLIILQRKPAELVAGELSGDLTFSDSTPSDGERIHVAYRPSANLSGEATLVLRARFRTRWDPQNNETIKQKSVATMKRRSNGLYEADVDLPRGAVYSVWAVELADGTVVDDHRGFPWQLLVHSAGKPRLDALAQQFYDVVSRSPDSALNEARRITGFYPNEPEAWTIRLSFETYMGGSQARANVLPEAMARFRAVDQALRAQTAVTAEQMLGLVSLAPQMSEATGPVYESGMYWKSRLLALASSSDVARYYAIAVMNSRVLRDSSQAKAALDSAERYWNAGDSLDGRSTRFVFQIAQRTKDSAEVMAWAHRLAQRDPLRAAFIYQEAARNPRLGQVGTREIRGVMTALEHDDPDYREVGQSVAEDRRNRREWYLRSQFTLGMLLLQLGDTTGALKELVATTAEGWDVTRFKQVAGLMLGVGDSVAASRLYSLVAVDPATPSVLRDSILKTYSAFWRGSELEGASKTMADRILATAINRRIPDSLSLQSSDATPMRLRQLLNGKVGVVAVWSRDCGPSVAQLRMLNDVKATLERQGAAFIPMTVGAPSPAAKAALIAGGAAWDSYYDGGGSVRQALNNIGTPEYYVIDRKGHVRFAGRLPWASVTEAAVLSVEDR